VAEGAEELCAVAGVAECGARAGEATLRWFANYERREGEKREKRRKESVEEERRKREEKERERSVFECTLHVQLIDRYWSKPPG
jgi:hypothetical protein